MSRRIPPTPVAAPWNGSTALGWLCDSTLNAHTRPPPTSTAPAFSPGPITTYLTLRRQRPQQLLRVLVRAVLAPQAASTSPAPLDWGGLIRPADQLVLGAESTQASARPRQSGAQRYQACTPSTVKRIDSKIFSPSAEPPISSATACSGCRHQPENVPPLVAHPRDVVHRAVEVSARRIPQHQLAGPIHRRQQKLPYRDLAPPRMLRRDAQTFAQRASVGERAATAEHLQPDLSEREAPVDVPQTAPPGSSRASHST